MDSKDAIFTSDTQIVRSPPMELGSPSMWPDHMVGQPEKPVRVLLIEQLYRAWSINANHPYHRE